jgi:hypothetical protein
MADAEDLKSSGDFSSCGFDSHPGHQSVFLKLNHLLRRPPCTRRVPLVALGGRPRRDYGPPPQVP